MNRLTMRVRKLEAQWEAETKGPTGWHWTEDGDFVPGPDQFPDLTGKFTDAERLLLHAWRLLYAYYTRWMEHLSEDKKLEWWTKYGVMQARDEDDLLGGLRHLLDDPTLTLEAVLLAAALVEGRFTTLMGGSEHASDWVLQIYRTIHPECTALAHLEPIGPVVGTWGPYGSPPRRHWWEQP